LLRGAAVFAYIYRQAMNKQRLPNGMGPQAAVLWAAIGSDPGAFIAVGEWSSGRILMASQAGAGLYGGAPGSLAGMPWTALLKGEGGRGDVLTRDMPRGTSRSWQDVFLAADGSAFPVSVFLSVFQMDGRDCFLVRIGDAGSDAEGRLKREKQRFEALFNHATMGIIVAGADGKIEMVNRYALTEFGYEEHELTGKRIEQLIPERFLEQHTAYRRSYNHHPEIRPMGAGRDLFARRRDGTEFPVEVSLSPYVTAAGLSVIAFIIDISVRKEKEAAERDHREEITRVNALIRRLNDELEAKVAERTRQLEHTLQELQASRDELRVSLEKEKELNDLKSRFVSMASHEFRTPLSTILSSASLIGKYTLAEDQAKRDKHVQRIKGAVNNLAGILGEFLSIGRIEDGMLSARFSVFDLPQLLSEVCDQMTDIKRADQQITYTHQGARLVRLDPELLRNILINLVSNAIKFSPGGGHIAVESRLVEAGGLTVSVRDQGLGIPPADQAHLFDRFFRGGNVVNIQGTGLGLYIVARYAELMGGAVSVRSTLGEGTEFILHFNAGTASGKEAKPTKA
jgi:PAS domain S-box-containing protein